MRSSSVGLFGFLLGSVTGWTYVEPSKRHQFPFGIVFMEVQYFGMRNTCTGSVIGNHTIITAAHCIDHDPWKIIIDINKGYDNVTRCHARGQELWNRDNKNCIQRIISIKTQAERNIRAVQHPDYQRTAPLFVNVHGAKSWLTADIAILTLETGIFETQEDLQRYAFRLPSLKKRRGSKKKRGNKKKKSGRARGKRRGKHNMPLYYGSGYGKTIPKTKGRGRKKRVVRTGRARGISQETLKAELLTELTYQKRTNYTRNIFLETLLDYPGGERVSLPEDWLGSRGQWVKSKDKTPGQYEVTYGATKSHNLLPTIKPTMCYGDSGGPMWRFKKVKQMICLAKTQRCTHKFVRQKYIFGINSIMDDLCQQFMVSISTKHHLKWIKNAISNTQDREWIFGARFGEKRM